jgi:hypothetical protein
MKYIGLSLFSFAHKKNQEKAIETQTHYLFHFLELKKTVTTGIGG